jgi:hypothetical protein
MRLLSPVEQAYLNGTREFTKPQIRYIKCRLKKKLRHLDEKGCNAAALLQRLEEEGRWDSMVRIPPNPNSISLESSNNHRTEDKKNEWAGGEFRLSKPSDSRPPPCQGGILTRLDHRPNI